MAIPNSSTPLLPAPLDWTTDECLCPRTGQLCFRPTKYSKPLLCAPANLAPSAFADYVADPSILNNNNNNNNKAEEGELIFWMLTGVIGLQVFPPPLLPIPNPFHQLALLLLTLFILFRGCCCRRRRKATTRERRNGRWRRRGNENGQQMAPSSSADMELEEQGQGSNEQGEQELEQQWQGPLAPPPTPEEPEER